MVTLGYEEVHDYVNKMQKNGKNIRWNGWNIELFYPNPRGYFSKQGVFRDGRWGFLKTYSPNSSGEWSIDEHNKPARNRSRLIYMA